MEWDDGDYEGRLTTEVPEEVPGWTIWTHPVPNGETAEDRWTTSGSPVLEEIRSVDGDVLIFAHGHVLRILAARWLDPRPIGGPSLRARIPRRVSTARLRARTAASQAVERARGRVAVGGSWSRGSGRLEQRLLAQLAAPRRRRFSLAAPFGLCGCGERSHASRAQRTCPSRPTGGDSPPRSNALGSPARRCETARPSSPTRRRRLRDARLADLLQPLQFGDLRTSGRRRSSTPRGRDPRRLLEGDLQPDPHGPDEPRAHSPLGIATWNIEYRSVGDPGRGLARHRGRRGASPLEYVAELPVDHTRVVLVGHGAGGQLALWATKRAQLPVVALAPVSDVRESAARTGPDGATARLFMAEEHFAEGSPIELLPLGVPRDRDPRHRARVPGPL